MLGGALAEQLDRRLVAALSGVAGAGLLLGSLVLGADLSVC